MDAPWTRAARSQGLALTSMRGRNDEAVAATKFALSLAPDHSEALNNLGVVYSQSGATLRLM